MPPTTPYAGNDDFPTEVPLADDTDDASVYAGADETALDRTRWLYNRLARIAASAKTCPHCDVEQKRDEAAGQKALVEEDGELVEVKPPTVEEREAWCSAAVATANRKGLKPGWVWHAYEDRFHVRMPNEMWKRVKRDVKREEAAGVSSATVARALELKNKAPEQFERVKRGEVTGAVQAMKREHAKAQLESTEAKEAKAIAGVYDVIVIDPPWDMEKIERDERPNQVAFDYPTMTETELCALKLPCADDAHVWVWTTHKHLPVAMRLLLAWGLKYVCTFVWHKPGGFQPIGLPQYNCEFAIYARRGTPVFIDTKALPTCFNAPRVRLVQGVLS